MFISAIDPPNSFTSLTFGATGVELPEPPHPAHASNPHAAEVMKTALLYNIIPNFSDPDLGVFKSTSRQVSYTCDRDRQYYGAKRLSLYPTVSRLTDQDL